MRIEAADESERHNKVTNHCLTTIIDNAEDGITAILYLSTLCAAVLMVKFPGSERRVALDTLAENIASRMNDIARKSLERRQPI